MNHKSTWSRFEPESFVICKKGMSTDDMTCSQRPPLTEDESVHKTWQEWHYPPQGNLS